VSSGSGESAPVSELVLFVRNFSIEVTGSGERYCCGLGAVNLTMGLPHGCSCSAVGRDSAGAGYWHRCLVEYWYLDSGASSA